jgi:asparagine synthase (glutamine-hydrolysing)
MSGFAAHLDFAMSPSRSADRVTSIAEHIAYRGPHRQAVRNVGACTLMHAALWTTPEAMREEQPLRHATRDLWLTADARVDNRAELAQLLDGAVQHPLDTDADFLMAAYERWGPDLLDHVVGDFAFALWDGERDELLVARDPVGVRPLFLARTANGAVVASTLPAVLAAFDPAGVDETYLSGFLHGFPSASRTIWSGIERLAPGHRCRIGRDGAVADRYWTPSLEPLEQSVEASAQLVRSTFDEAVRCRLRSVGPIACDLSGGLDSSTIAATAVELGADVKPISLVYRDPEAFELPHIQAVAEHLGIVPELIEATEVVTLDAMADIRDHREPLYSIDATDTGARFDRAAALGCTVILLGVGGDELLYATGTTGRPSPLGSLRDTAKRWAARHPRGIVARAIGDRRRRRGNRERPWLRVPGPIWPGLGQTSPYDVPWSPPAYELTDRLAAERGLEVRSPFLDRRLIELGLRVPPGHRRAGGHVRGLHRLAFGDRLPAAVAARTDKAELTGSFARRTRTVMESHPADAAWAALGDRVQPELLASSDPWHRWLTYSAGMFLSESRD